MAVTGWEITEWTVAVASFLTAAGVIHVKVVRPLRGFARRFKAWMDRMEASATFVESMMRPNGGSSLADRVDRADRRTDVLTRYVVDCLQLMAPKLGVKLPDPPRTLSEEDAA